jgi:hypothetical protein
MKKMKFFILIMISKIGISQDPYAGYGIEEIEDPYLD